MTRPYRTHDLATMTCVTQRQAVRLPVFQPLLCLSATTAIMLAGTSQCHVWTASIWSTCHDTAMTAYP